MRLCSRGVRRWFGWKLLVRWRPIDRLPLRRRCAERHFRARLNPRHWYARPLCANFNSWLRRFSSLFFRAGLGTRIGGCYRCALDSLRRIRIRQRKKAIQNEQQKFLRPQSRSGRQRTYQRSYTGHERRQVSQFRQANTIVYLPAKSDESAANCRVDAMSGKPSSKRFSTTMNFHNFSLPTACCILPTYCNTPGRTRTGARNQQLCKRLT